MEEKALLDQTPVWDEEVVVGGQYKGETVLAIAYPDPELAREAASCSYLLLLLPHAWIPLFWPCICPQIWCLPEAAESQAKVTRVILTETSLLWEVGEFTGAYCVPIPKSARTIPLDAILDINVSAKGFCLCQVPTLCVHTAAHGGHEPELFISGLADPDFVDAIVKQKRALKYPKRSAGGEESFSELKVAPMGARSVIVRRWGKQKGGVELPVAEGDDITQLCNNAVGYLYPHETSPPGEWGLYRSDGIRITSVELLKKGNVVYLATSQEVDN